MLQERAQTRYLFWSLKTEIVLFFRVPWEVEKLLSVGVDRQLPLAVEDPGERAGGRVQLGKHA